jgi:hypothetical protein
MIDTLIVAPLHAQRRDFALPPGGNRTARRVEAPADRVFRIRSADTCDHRDAADSLLKERYAWRGYHAVSLPKDQTTNRITLAASENDATIGTITVALDGPEGLSAEDAFGAEIAALRARKRRVCEFTKLAIDATTSSKRVLAALFHVAYIVAHKIRAFDTLVMEVNPRHVGYYRRMLGARILGSERTNRFVDAPAVLLTIDFSYIREEIGRLGGRPESAASERSLYPFFFSAREELGIVGRFMRAQTATSASIN